MTLDLVEATPVAGAPDALQQALGQSQDVKEKVEGCADDLASANDVVKQQIARGVTTLPAHTTLRDSEAVGGRVQQCADDLEHVNETLAQGIDDLRQTEGALSRSRAALRTATAALATSEAALVCSEAALLTAQDGESKAKLRALHDSATGLPNRELFDDRLEHAISLAERHRWTLAVMFLDLDRFKSVNDTHGHAAGDSVLKEVARRLLEHCRDEDTVCRNGGDEFLYLLMNPQGTVNIERIAHAVLKSIARPIDVGGVQLVVAPSIGVAVFPHDGVDAAQLIANADSAMYRAKKRAAGCVLFGAAEVASGPG